MESSERIAELEEAVEALQAGIERYSRLTDVALEVIDLLLREVSRDAPIEWAKKIDALISQRETLRRRPDDVEMRWLAQMRQQLVSWHELKPAVDQAWADGSLRLQTTRERLHILDGGKSDAPPDSPTLPPDVPSNKR